MLRLIARLRSMHADMGRVETSVRGPPRIIIRRTKIRERFLSCGWTFAGSSAQTFAVIGWRQS